MTSFADLGLATPILKALESEGYVTPTPIQAQAIPHVLLGKDLQGIAQTGTGKTAAFALPIIHRLLEAKQPPLRKGCRVLVLSPTRELASQIADNFKAYAKHTSLRVTLMFGGVPKMRQSRAIANGVDVLVATPGRLRSTTCRMAPSPCPAPRSWCSTRPTTCWTSASSFRSARS